MSDEGEIWEGHRNASQEKKRKNRERSIEILHKEGIEFEMLTDYHLRIGEYDFWPSTGVFMNRLTKYKSRGVFELLKILKYMP